MRSENPQEPGYSPVGGTNGQEGGSGSSRAVLWLSNDALEGVVNKKWQHD